MGTGPLFVLFWKQTTSSVLLHTLIRSNFGSKKLSGGILLDQTKSSNSFLSSIYLSNLVSKADWNVCNWMAKTRMWRIVKGRKKWYSGTFWLKYWQFQWNYSNIWSSVSNLTQWSVLLNNEHKIAGFNLTVSEILLKH